AAHRRGIGPDVLADAMREHGDGEAAAVVALCGAPLDVAQIVADAGEPEKPALAVETLVDARVIPAGGEEREDHSGIDVSRARPHHEAFERRHAHARLGGVTELAGACARAVAEVYRHEPELGERPAQM